MSTFTIIPSNPAMAPSLGLSAPAATPCTGVWATDVMTTAAAGAAHRTYARVQGEVAFEGKRRAAQGSHAWRSTDC